MNLFIKLNSCKSLKDTIYMHPEVYDDINYKASKLSKVFTSFVKNILIKYLNKYNDLRILDVGCGIARNTIELSSMGNFVVGIDISKEMITYAKTNVIKNKAIGLICGDILDNDVVNFIKEKYGLFDAITLFYNTIALFSPLENLLKLLKTLNELLKPGGLIIADASNPTSQLTPVRVWLLHRSVGERTYMIYTHNEIDLVNFNVKGLLLVFRFDSDGVRVFYDVEKGTQYPADVYRLAGLLTGFRVDVYGDFNVDRLNPSRAQVLNLVFVKGGDAELQV